jgi:ABC-2 type transport system ATP-binding protein
MLVAHGVRKRYGDTVALDGVDLVVEGGTILGLLGPNGAGKTSLVSIVAGLRRPDAGTVHVAGIDVARDPQRAQASIGYAPQETGVYPTLTVRDNLRFFAGLTGLRRTDLRERVDEVGAALGLTDLFERRASEISGGERRRLHTAIALVHRPALVLLDEPTTGADVRTRTEILDLVRSLAAAGSAVVYSTHYLHEIEELGATVAFIDRGRIVASGALDDLVSRY